MIQLRWSVRARGDLAGIDSYYRSVNRDFAQRALFAAVAAANFLLEQPRAGQVVDRTIFRKWRVADTLYLLLYRETRSELRIVRVVHHAQNRQKFL